LTDLNNYEAEANTVVVTEILFVILTSTMVTIINSGMHAELEVFVCWHETCPIMKHANC